MMVDGLHVANQVQLASIKPAAQKALADAGSLSA